MSTIFFVTTVVALCLFLDAAAARGYGSQQRTPVVADMLALAEEYLQDGAPEAALDPIRKGEENGSKKCVRHHWRREEQTPCVCFERRHCGW